MKLSPDLYLLHYIYQNFDYGTTHYTELVEKLKGIMTKAQVMMALHTLDDWGLMEVEYGETRPGGSGKLWRLDPKYATRYSFQRQPYNLAECEVAR